MYPFEMLSNVDHLDARQQYIIHHMLSIMYHILPLAYQNIESMGINKVSVQLEIFFRWNPSGTFRNVPWYH